MRSSNSSSSSSSSWLRTRNVRQAHPLENDSRRGVRRRGHLFQDRIQSSRILTTLYHTPSRGRARARSHCAPPHPLTANSSSAVITSMETLVFNPYCHIVTPCPPSLPTSSFRPVVPRCFSFPRLFFSPYLVPSPHNFNNSNSR